MNTKKITESEIAERAVASLPTRPTSSSLYGGEGYSPSEMKAAFDRLPIFIIQRFNTLIEDIAREGDGSLADAIPTGLYEGHSLSRLFEDIENGNLASYIKVGGESLASVIARLEAKIL